MKSNLERIETIRATIISRENEIKHGIQIKTYPIKDYRGDTIIKPIIRLHHDYLMYRIENSRTFRQQLHFIHKNNLDSNFFSDPENPDVQKAQEEILLELIHNSSNGQEFIDDLKNRGQDDPTIITYEGYIVNGNRRVAALKELGVEYVDCLVLPEDANKKDIYALEHLLQISEDYKEEYHWVNELMNFYLGLHDSSLNYTKDQMAKAFRIKKSELESKLVTMSLVNEFLQWKGLPNQFDYERLDLAEEVFRQLEKGIRKHNDEHKRQELIHAVFHLIENPPTKGRLYSQVSYLISNWDEIYKRMTSNQKIEPEESKNKGTQEEGTDLVDEFLDAKKLPQNEIFKDSPNNDELATKLYETIADVKAEGKEQSEAEAVYEGISAALREIMSLHIDEKTTKIESIKNKLVQLINIAQQLLEQINKNEE